MARDFRLSALIDPLDFRCHVGNEPHSIAGILAAKEPDSFVGFRGSGQPFGALRPSAAVSLPPDLRGDDIFCALMRRQRRKSDGAAQNNEREGYKCAP